MSSGRYTVSTIDDSYNDCSNANDAAKMKKACNSNNTMRIQIISAIYGPIEVPSSNSKRLSAIMKGELSEFCGNTESTARTVYSRDVTSYIKALLSKKVEEEKDARDNEEEEEESCDCKNYDVQYYRRQQQHSYVFRRSHRNFIPLMDGKSMNTTFGDPCPGTTKILKLHYMLNETSFDSSSSDQRVKRRRSKVYNESFCEHERLVLRRRIPIHHHKQIHHHHQRNSDDVDNDDDEEEEEVQQQKEVGNSPSARSRSLHIGKRSFSLEHPLLNERYTLQPCTSEIVLPLVLQYLTIHERLQCQLEICKSWYYIIKQWGVATVIDIGDESLFPHYNDDTINEGGSNGTNDNSVTTTSTMSFLCGLITKSFCSLRTLILTNCYEITKRELHPIIRNLTALRTLDISHCVDLDDTTLAQIASSKNLCRTLEVLYMKGLSNVTDIGLVSIGESCYNIQVLDISYITKLTDESIISIGNDSNYQQNLNVLYMRDNYLLTNSCIDVILSKCCNLKQLTLWGCMKVKYLINNNNDGVVANNSNYNTFFFDNNNLVQLNLWGCHNLSTEETSNSLKYMNNLRSLVVSECHQLTDKFFVQLAQDVPQIHHLYLRYCRRITNIGLDAITNHMKNLQSLDLSFCTKLTHQSIIHLLDLRIDTLTELRMQSCSQFNNNITGPLLAIADVGEEEEQASMNVRHRRSIIDTICSRNDESSLGVLDLRGCFNANDANHISFAIQMNRLQFEERLPGFFVRPARWNEAIRQRLLNQMVDENGHVPSVVTA